MNDIPNIHTGQSWKEKMRGERNTSQGDIKIEKYLRYYDRTNTITVAGPTNPNNQDSNVYNVENVDDAIQRCAPFLNIANDGIDNLYVIVSHGGGQTFSQENVLYPGDIKTYKNIYEVRLRSPTAGLSYRVSEYDIYRTCCPIDIVNINPSWIHATEVIAPGAGTILVSQIVSVGKSGFIYGFLITAQEANNFLINWTSGGIARSIRIVFGAGGSTQDTEVIPLNEGLPADSSTNITITNVTAAGIGKIYQGRLLYVEI